MAKNYTPQKHDVIIGILYFIGPGKEIPTSFDTSIELYRAKQKYPELMKDFLFDTNGQFPYSEDIISVISHLKLSGLLVSTGITSRDLRIDNAVAVSFEDLRKKLTEKQLSDLEKIAAEFESHRTGVLQKVGS